MLPVMSTKNKAQNLEPLPEAEEADLKIEVMPKPFKVEAEP